MKEKHLITLSQETIKQIEKHWEILAIVITLLLHVGMWEMKSDFNTTNMH